MAITLSLYGVFIGSIVFYWGMTFFVLYHLIRFGIGTKPKRLSFIFLLGSIFLTLISTIMFLLIDTNEVSEVLIKVFNL